MTAAEAARSPLAVVAVGGNSLITDPKRTATEDQRVAAAQTAEHVADLIAAGWRVVLTHGNGPQVGFELLRSDAANAVVPPVPMDACGAMTQGTIGYLLQQTLGNALHARGLDRTVAAVVTQVEVDPADPAFAKPTKPVGPFYTAEEADRLRSEQGWTIVEDAGRGHRRVVPSPRPAHVRELAAIRALLDQGVVVIAVGGGGVPVVRDAAGQLSGVAAVIDKDHASSLLASELGADLLLISTGVDRVAVNFGKPDQRDLDRLTVAEARQHLADGQFPAGSMGPKVEAIVRFLEAGGREALITSPAAIGRALAGQAGTRVVAEEGATRIPAAGGTTA